MTEEIFSIKGTFKEGGSSLSPRAVTIKLDVNAIATASVTCESSEKEIVRRGMSPELIQRMRKRQSKRLAGNTEPDAELSLELTAASGSGGGQPLKFTGFVTAPQASTSVGATPGDTLNVVGDDALLDALNLSIYTTAIQSMRGPFTFSTLKPEKVPSCAPRCGLTRRKVSRSSPDPSKRA